jgi:hypothetical protein
MRIWKRSTVGSLVHRERVVKEREDKDDVVEPTHLAFLAFPKCCSLKAEVASRAISRGHSIIFHQNKLTFLPAGYAGLVA